MISQTIVEVASKTDVGAVRELNEDCIIAQTLTLGPTNPLELTAIVMVADGLGGHHAGEVASALAGETVTDRLVNHQSTLTAENGGRTQPVTDLLAIVARSVNDKVRAYGDATPAAARPATTLTLCAIAGGDYHIAHVGDSRAYLLCTLRGVVQLTEDDSWVAEAVRTGKMSLEEAKNSPYRNQLTRSVGTSEDILPSLYSGALDYGDVVVLCTDGLTEYVDQDEILDEFSHRENLQQACDVLVDAAFNRGGHDNISIVAARCGTVRPRVPVTAPVMVGKLRSQVSKSGSRRVADPNKRLKPLFAILILLAASILGAWAGMRFATHRQPPPVVPAPIIVPYVSSDGPPISQPKPHRHRANRHPVSSTATYGE